MRVAFLLSTESHEVPVATIVRLVIILSGISGVAFIVTDMLKMWQIVNPAFSPAWFIVPFNMLFLTREAVNSSWGRKSGRISATTRKYMGRAIETLIILLFIILLVSIPFVWTGVIDTVSGRAGAVTF